MFYIHFVFIFAFLFFFAVFIYLFMFSPVNIQLFLVVLASISVLIHLFSPSHILFALYFTCQNELVEWPSIYNIILNRRGCCKRFQAFCEPLPDFFSYWIRPPNTGSFLATPITPFYCFKSIDLSQRQVWSLWMAIPVTSDSLDGHGTQKTNKQTKNLAAPLNPHAKIHSEKESVLCLERL